MTFHSPLNISAVAKAGPVMPVVVLHDVTQAVPLARALLEGGIGVMEVTLRTSAALPGIERIARELPELMLGAGTVLTVEDVGRAASAGASFAVSPGFSPRLAQACRDAGMPWLPGVATAGEVMQARELGYTVQKCFPAQALSGLALLKAWSGPFEDVMFCPTGGITPDNAPHYLALKNVVCVGGSWLVPAAALARSDWASITALARTTAALRPAHNAPLKS